MLTGVQVFNALGALAQTLYLSELNPASKYVITGIKGQGPVKAEINTSSFGNSDGEFFQSAKTPKRNIVLTLGYNPNYAVNETVEDLRLALYRIFPPKENLQLRMLNTKMETVAIEGWVESVEPDIWSSQPSVDISIICPSPSFVSLEETVIAGKNYIPILLNYKGSATTGFRVNITAGRDLDVVDINTGRDYLKWETSLPTDSVMRLSTEKGNRFIRKNSNNAIAGLTQGSLRTEIGPLNTSITVGTTPATPSNSDVTVTYTNHYVGV